MKKENIKKLITLLKNAKDPLSSSELSQLLHVDQRTVRNYVKEINLSNDYSI
jgi:transcriptional antiterminator